MHIRPFSTQTNGLLTTALDLTGLPVVVAVVDTASTLKSYSRNSSPAPHLEWVAVQALEGPEQEVEKEEARTR